MTRIPLQVLPTFCVVAELENLRAAADQLHLTHSAVSQQIRLLEGQLGRALFDRKGRRLHLNDAGRALLHHARLALAQVEQGVQAAATPAGQPQRLRISVVPSFAQHWLLPRIHRWRARHPDIELEIDASQRVADLSREGFHAALRQGVGPWKGVLSERLFEPPMPLFVVGCASASRRLLGAPPRALLDEPLIGDAELWRLWFAMAGVEARVRPVATFNDNGLMLQAAEQGMGLALVREPLAADSLGQGRLLKLSPLALDHEMDDNYHLVHAPQQSGWPPLAALRQWLREEIEASRQALDPPG